jgi:hypothetical protein
MSSTTQRTAPDEELAALWAASSRERSSAAEAVAASVRILATVASRDPHLLDHDQPSPSPECEAAAPFRAVLERARTEGAIRNDVPLEQLGASLRGLLAGTLRAARLRGADLDAAGPPSLASSWKPPARRSIRNLDTVSTAAAPPTATRRLASLW